MSKTLEIPPYRVTSGMGGVKPNHACVTIGGSKPDKEYETSVDVKVNDRIVNSVPVKTLKNKRKKLVYTRVYDSKNIHKLTQIKAKMGLSKSSVYNVALSYYYDSLQLEKSVH